MLLRVILSPNDIRRLTIEERPPTVEKLYEILRNKLGIRGSFSVQFEDPDFGNALCNLQDIQELPADRATLKVLLTADSGEGSDSTLDTGSLSTHSIGTVDLAEWPDPYPIPQFSYDTELKLMKANAQYAKAGYLLEVNKGMKSDILDCLADGMCKITPYPESHHYEIVARALVDKHPSLRDPGSAAGWYSWVHSLKYKVGNFRRDLAVAGLPEVVVNKRKGGEAKRKVKKSKKGEVHFCPEQGDSVEVTEENRMKMEREMLKTIPDRDMVDELMVSTFAQRRREIVGDEPLLREIRNRWPALLQERQIRAEFERVTAQELLPSFLNGLDALVPRLLELYKSSSKSGRCRSLGAILTSLEKDNTNERKRTAVLLGLPLYLKEDSSNVFRLCDAHYDHLDEALKGMELGLLIAYEEEQDAVPHQVFDVAVVVWKKA
ncbi:unnamed protein product [Knipowitschia caucasica]